MMRLLLLTSEFPPGPGGIGTHAYQLARGLTDLGWQVHVVARQNYVEKADVASFNQAQPFPVTSLRTIPGAPLEAVYRGVTIAGIIRRWQPDLIVATGQRMAWLAAALTRPFRRPLVVIGHGTEFSDRTRWEYRLTKWAFERATYVVCVSRFTWDKMQAVGIRPREGIVIPNGADETRFVRLDNAGSPKDSVRRLLTVGNVTERKGQEVVIRALPAVIEQYGKVRYQMIGLPTRGEQLASLARELGVEEHIEFLGRVDQDTLVRSINACDLFVMTSRHTADGDFEGYGIAVVEAALCGKPAIVADNSGLVEAVEADETGLVVGENDVRATAAAIVRLLKDDQMRLRMGEAARARALREQTWSRRAAQYHQVLQQVVEVDHTL